MNEGQRFAFGDPWYLPESLYPSFMSEMLARYPTYGMVYDRRREQWLVFTWLHEATPEPIAYVEHGDGTAAEPCMEFLDRLSACDVIREFGTPEKYLDWLEREMDRYKENAEQTIEDEIAYAARPIHDYIERGAPESIVIRPLKAEHRAQVQRDLALSASAAKQTMEVLQ